MPQAVNTSVENNFVEGLKTEFTGLNFPENACTSTDNCVFTLIGEVFRRDGIDYEANFTTTPILRQGAAISSYIWTNVGGDGQTKVYVLQVANVLYFYQITNATSANPLSTTKLSATINIVLFQAAGNSNNPGVTECQFTDGNGYLFVFHPDCDPFYCTFISGAITAKVIPISIRDFRGIPEPGVPDNYRPNTLSAEHNYNLVNQGWTSGTPWSANINNSSPFNIVAGSNTLSIVSQTNTTSVTNGASVQIAVFFPFSGTTKYAYGTVTTYTTPFTSITINVTSGNTSFPIATGGSPTPVVTVSLTNLGFIPAWLAAIGNYPSNSDIWWQFKNSSGIFAPATTIGSVQLIPTPAPKGSFILNAFNQDRATISSIVGLTPLSTTVRPRTGTFFQGRVWYAGVDASSPPAGDEPFYTWTENIYFSQIIVDTSQFGKCYQTNDPTSQTLFDLLPSDGGVIVIQGSGSIYKLFPIQNGLIVFAANGIWFITGSQGIGFSASDYTITKLSGIQSISSTSFVNVMGYPMFWNEEGIYGVAPANTGALTVNNLCLGTILSFYLGIPLQSKKYVRGDYDPLTFQIKWVYKSANEFSITDRYQFDKVLNFNVIHKSFYPYTISGTPFLHDVKYVSSPGGTGSPSPVMKFLTSAFDGVTFYNFTFSEERDSTFVDWKSFDGVGVSFISTFTTGYKVHGQALRKFQPLYVYVYSRNDIQTAYTINAIWDFATSGNSGRYSVRQQTTNYSKRNQGMVYRRHRLRGRGMSLQLQFTSIPNQPFEIMGWAIYEHVTMSP